MTTGQKRLPLKLFRSLPSESSPSPSVGSRSNSSIGKRVEFMVILLYSLAVMGSATPFFSDISNVPVVIYYLFVPGYCLSWFFREDYAMIQRVLFSGLLSITLVLAFFSLRQTVLVGVHLPYDLSIPVFTLIVLLLHQFDKAR